MLEAITKMALMSMSSGSPFTATKSPVTTGTSVLGIVYADGVMVAADVLASYGSLARFRDVPRVERINSSTVLACGGDYADYQFLSSAIQQKIIDEECAHDGHELTPKALYSWLTRVHYNRRSKFDPLWCNWIIGGLNDGKPFLGFVDKLGAAFESDCIATGYGAMIALPLMREALERNGGPLSRQQAQELMEKCIQVLYYRDARSYPKYHLAVVNKDGATLEGPLQVSSNWDVAHYVRGYE